ncbi:MAG: hypothetical protein QOF14_1894 [Hyphomicrobiales bacterium]|jgi:uncharacterized MAPEG superfamily protein|nr:hypothetical protein [Hyphomicrobiales bacterium]
MMTTVQALVWSGILTLVVALAASALCAKVWEPGGPMIAFGNREGLAPPVGMAGRADRASKNQLEAMAMFLAVVLAAHIAGKAPQAALGATIFFWARLVYWPVYLAGIVYLRTLVWFVSLFGLFLIIREIW